MDYHFLSHSNLGPYNILVLAPLIFDTCLFSGKTTANLKRGLVSIKEQKNVSYQSIGVGINIGNLGEPNILWYPCTYLGR